MVREFMDVSHERFLVLLFAVVAANGSVHDIDPHSLTEVERLEAKRQPILSGKIGVAGERDRNQAEPVHQPLDAPSAFASASSGTCSVQPRTAVSSTN